MEGATEFVALACRDLPFVEFAREFCRLAAAKAWEDATINSLFWIEANYHRPVDLPDWAGGKGSSGVWRESSPDPEPAHRRSQLPQACCRSRPMQARRRMRLPQARRRSLPTQKPAAVHGSLQPTVHGEIDAAVCGPRKPAVRWEIASVRGSFKPAVRGEIATVRGSPKHAGSEYGKPASSEYGKPAGRGSPKPSASSSTAPSSASSSTAPSRARSSTAPSRACSSTTPSRARSSTTPSSASPSNAHSCACASRVPSSASPSKAPCSACVSRGGGWGRGLGGGPAMASRVPGSAIAARAPRSAMAARAPCSAMASRVPGSAMAAWAPGSAMADRAPCSAMATRAPRSAMDSGTGAALDASCPVLSPCPLRPPERPPHLPFDVVRCGTHRSGGGSNVRPVFPMSCVSLLKPCVSLPLCPVLSSFVNVILCLHVPCVLFK